MGSGTLLQIVSYGAQDVYLTGNPQMSHFKFVFRQHTNFAAESIALDFNAPVHCPNLATKKRSNNLYSCVIPHTADFLLGVTIEIIVHIPNKSSLSLVKHPGWNLLDYVDLLIGGVSIDKQTGEWINLWYQLHDTLEQRQKLERLTNLSIGTENSNLYKLYLPIPFFFTKNYAMALPMLAMRHNEVKVVAKFNNISALFRKFSNVSNAYIHDTRVYTDMAFVAPDTKKLFLNQSLFYNIEQVQYNTMQVAKKSRSATLDLHFNHAVKQLVFTCQDSAFTTDPDYNYPHCYSGYNNSGNIVRSAKLVFNTVDRMEERDADYFRLVQTLQFNASNSYLSDLNRDEEGYYYAYSFALAPNDYRHTGSCNFSYIINPQLLLKLKESEGNFKNITVYGVSYNVLEVCSNMASVIFA